AARSFSSRHLVHAGQICLQPLSFMSSNARMCHGRLLRGNFDRSGVFTVAQLSPPTNHLSTDALCPISNGERVPIPALSSCSKSTLTQSLRRHPHGGVGPLIPSALAVLRFSTRWTSCAI